MKIMDDSVNNLFGIREEHADKDVKAIYNKEKANANINNLIDFVIRGLCKLNKPFKYSVTGVIMQNNGAGLNTCSNPPLIQRSPTMTPTTTAQSPFRGKSETTSSYSPSSPCKFDIFIDWSHNTEFDCSIVPHSSHNTLSRHNTPILIGA
jgi:hypothetical protein